MTRTTRSGLPRFPGMSILLALLFLFVTQPASARSPRRVSQSRPTSQPAASGTVASQPADQVDPLPPGEDVTLTTEDNLVIAGRYTLPRKGLGEAAPMVVLLHMYDRDHTDFDPLVTVLHRAGFAVLAIDLRGHGGSVGLPAMGLADRVAKRDHKLFQQMYRDVTAAYLWLRERVEVDRARFALIGASVGCSVALDYAGRDPSVDAVVCLTPGTAYLGIDSVTDVRKIGRRPLLLLASKEERAAVDRLCPLGEDATFQIYPDQPDLGPMGLHGTRMLGKAAGVESRIVTFLRKAVGPPSDEIVVGSIKGEVFYGPDSSQARRLSGKNLRWFSSPVEAEARGYRLPKGRNFRSR